MFSPSSENTILVNVTHKMLTELQLNNPHLVSTIPTQNMENVLGYDMEFDNWKLFFLQYKRPYLRRNRFYFNLDPDQNIRLWVWPLMTGVQCAFYPLALIPSDQHLARFNPNLLDYVFFIDVMDVFPISSQIRIDFNPQGIPLFSYKIKYGPWMPIRQFYSWKTIRKYVELCEIGGIMKKDGEATTSNLQLRETISQLIRNEMPDWLPEKLEQAELSFEEIKAGQLSNFFFSLLLRNRELEKPTMIASRSFRAFIYPLIK